MAIDTEAKRRSATNVPIPGMIVPAPDGSIASADRATLTGVYGGILAGSGGGYSGPLWWAARRKRRHYGRRYY